MDPKNDIEDLEPACEPESSAGVDDFIRELEAKERDLHITADMKLIDIADGADGYALPEFMQAEFPATTVPEPAAPADETAADAAVASARLVQLQSKVEKLESEREGLFDDLRRRTRDFEAIKARTERERAETFEKQVSNLAVRMLPVLDNLDRAVEFAVKLEDGQPNDLRLFLDGMILIHQQVNDILEEMGIVPIATVGEGFDPHYHEAVDVIATDEFPANTVCTELRRGYRIGSRVVRHSMVRVSAPKPESSEAGD